MNKKRISFVLVAGLLSSLSIIPANAAVKAGAACKTAGITSVASGKTFTCIKSGKKLVWNKGIKVSSSSNSSSGNLPNSSKKIINVDINDLKTTLVYEKSRQEISEAIQKSTYVNSSFAFNIGPNQVSSRVETEKNALNRAAKLWSNIYKSQEKIEVIFYDFSDLDWAKLKYAQISGSANFHSADSCSSSYCGNATVGRYASKVLVWEQGLGGTLWNRSTTAHEYTHLAQTSGSENYWNTAPLWLVEGMAQFYGEAVSYVSFDTQLTTRRELHRQYVLDSKSIIDGDLKAILDLKNSNKVKELMSLIEFPASKSQANTALAYLLGSYASEVLVAVYGHSSFENFVKSFSDSSDWKTNFSKNFGITSDDFYSKLVPYFADASNEL